MANLQDICAKQGMPIENYLDFAAKNIEESKQQIFFLQEERDILSQQLNLQKALWDADRHQFQKRLQTNELMCKEKELTHAYEIAKTNLLHGTDQKDVLLLKLRLDSALDDLDELQTRYEFLMLELKEEQAKAQALNKGLLEKEKEPIMDQSQTILEMEQRMQGFQEKLFKMEKDHCNEIAKVKSECKRISSLWRNEVSALLREKDFVWNQLKRMEEDYADRLKCKNEQLQVAYENIEKLRLAMEELQKANDEKNVELTIMKVELGEKEREVQILKENVLSNSKPHKSLQEPRSAVKISSKRKGMGMEVLPTVDACGPGTSKDSSELNAVYQTCSQEINTKQLTLNKKDIIVLESIQNHKDNKLRSVVCVDEEEKHEKIFSTFEIEAENAHLKDKEVPVKDIATSIKNICHSLNTELDKLAVGSDLVIQLPTNEPLLNDSPHIDNNKVVDGMDLVIMQYPPGRHEKSALKL